jgi:orotate phosphoribosyltransferase
MDRHTLAEAIRDSSKLSGHFVLRSGRTSDTYFDKYLFESDPTILRAVADQLSALVPNDTEILCGLEMGGIPVAAMLSQVTGLPCAFLRKERKPYGTKKFAEGPDLRGRRILLVEDVVSSGGAIIDEVAMLRDDGIAVDRAVCVIDRQTGGVEALDAIGVTLESLFTMEEIEGDLWP